LAGISGLIIVARRSRYPRFLKTRFVIITPLAVCGLNFQKPARFAPKTALHVSQNRTSKRAKS
jgi:hypothetical protein